VIPQIDKFQTNGYTKEEMKVAWETRKIFGYEVRRRSGGGGGGGGGDDGDSTSSNIGVGGDLIPMLPQCTIV